MTATEWRVEVAIPEFDHRARAYGPAQVQVGLGLAVVIARVEQFPLAIARQNHGITMRSRNLDRLLDFNNIR